MAADNATVSQGRLRVPTVNWKSLLTGEWVIDRSTARQRRIIHYWLTIGWLTIGLVVWLMLEHVLWFVGFMSLYAIWITHMAGWAAETPVEGEPGGSGENTES